jgi:hypothetical protein
LFKSRSLHFEDVPATANISMVDLHGFDYLSCEYQIAQTVKNPRTATYDRSGPKCGSERVSGVGPELTPLVAQVGRPSTALRPPPPHFSTSRSVRAPDYAVGQRCIVTSVSDSTNGPPSNRNGQAPGTFNAYELQLMIASSSLTIGTGSTDFPGGHFGFASLFLMCGALLQDLQIIRDSLS